MNIQQAVKMAWKSIWGKKGRSALTMLGIIIGIAAVMTIVSAINGYTEKTMEQYEAMGSNKLTVNIWNYLYDEDGNSLGQDYFPALYDYCNSIKEYVLGVTPQAYCNATVVYGTKSTANMSYNYDENGNLTGDVPPSIYYGSDQYSICNNLALASGRLQAIPRGLLSFRVGHPGLQAGMCAGGPGGKDLLRRRGPRGQGAPAQRAEL